MMLPGGLQSDTEHHRPRAEVCRYLVAVDELFTPWKTLSRYSRVIPGWVASVKLLYPQALKVESGVLTRLVQGWGGSKIEYP